MEASNVATCSCWLTVGRTAIIREFKLESARTSHHNIFRPPDSVALMSFRFSPLRPEPQYLTSPAPVCSGCCPQHSSSPKYLTYSPLSSSVHWTMSPWHVAMWIMWLHPSQREMWPSPRRLSWWKWRNRLSSLGWVFDQSALTNFFTALLLCLMFEKIINIPWPRHF